MKLRDLKEANEQNTVGDVLRSITDRAIENKRAGYEKTGVWDGTVILINRPITSLEGCPKKINGRFELSDCKPLRSLAYGPEEIAYSYTVSRCPIKSLDGLKCKIGLRFNLFDTKVNSLKDIHKKIEFTSNENDCGVILKNNPIKSHILGLLLIKGAKFINFGTLSEGNETLVKCGKIFIQAMTDFDDPRKRVMWAQSELVKQLGEEGKALAQL